MRKWEPSFDFLGKRRYTSLLSLILVIGSIILMATRGLNFGVDFTGGTVIEVGYPVAIELDQVRETLAGAGFDEFIVQHFGSATEVMVRMPPLEGVQDVELSQRVMTVLQEDTPGVELRRVEFVGPQIGEELIEQGGLAVLFALFGILVYVAFRFEYRFSVGAVAALAHDVIITLGLFAVTQMTFDITVLAALLAVVGYSLNDSIVISDRIRENFVKLRKGTTVEVMNLSINQTLSRTLVTSGTTFAVVLALYLVGGEVMAGFSAALMCGIAVGTYSSIYTGTALALAMGVSKADLVPPEKEGANAEGEGFRP